MKRESDRLETCVVELARHSDQPSRAELHEDRRVDATFEEFVEACLRSTRIPCVKPRRKR